MIPVIIGTTFLIYTMVWTLPSDPSPAGAGNGPARRPT